MDFAIIKNRAEELFKEAAFIAHIAQQSDYAKALALLDDLIDDYEANRLLIEVLGRSIQVWEDEADEFAEFNARIAKLDGTDV
jgi:HTH-type transcriptional regulator/antitoxin HigA